MAWLSLLVSPDTPYHSKVMLVIVLGVSSLDIQNVRNVHIYSVLLKLQ